MDILSYESKIWASADLLIAASIKQSDFPKFMMPFFALKLMESRLIRKKKEIMTENKFAEKDIDKVVALFKLDEKGYNELIIKNDITLKKICENDKGHQLEFDKYLKAFDSETRTLLGIDVANDNEKYLNITGICGELKGKKILFDFMKTWAEIDLEPFDNSEITTLEEHIKRRWADISADTAGEQYTPDDIIKLISEIVASKIDLNSTENLSIYDPTCGGGNLLFGTEDHLLEKNCNRVISTFGMDNNSTLYALAKIESMFRDDSQIEYNNTLTSLTFNDKKFDVIVANPPYGLTWKGFKKEVETDKTGRFHALPSVSDSQMLFDQHIAHYMNNEKGIAVIVNNGSPLFSGDAGSGESEIRKYFFDNDWVEALIQMPASEFFNTGIYTYLWVLNRNKDAKRKNKVILINGSSLFDVLKKSKGDKRNTMNDEHRAKIVKALANFKDCDIAKVYDKYFCYYNKFFIQLFNVDASGKAFCDYTTEGTWGKMKMPVAKDVKLKATAYEVQVCKKSILKNTFLFSDGECSSKYENFLAYAQTELYPTTDKVNKVFVDDNHYFFFDEEKQTLVEMLDGKRNELGKGFIVPYWKYKKATTKKTKITEVVDGKKVKKELVENVPESVELSFYLVPDTQNDYEIIPLNKDEKENEKDIKAFMQKYVFRPWSFNKNIVGTEINFNKIFYVPEVLQPAEDILSAVQALDNELTNLENSFTL